MKNIEATKIGWNDSKRYWNQLHLGFRWFLKFTIIWREWEWRRWPQNSKNKTANCKLEWHLSYISTNNKILDLQWFYDTPMSCKFIILWLLCSFQKRPIFFRYGFLHLIVFRNNLFLADTNDILSWVNTTRFFLSSERHWPNCKNLS